MSEKPGISGLPATQESATVTEEDRSIRINLQSLPGLWYAGECSDGSPTMYRLDLLRDDAEVLGVDVSDKRRQIALMRALLNVAQATVDHMAVRLEDEIRRSRER